MGKQLSFNSSIVVISHIQVPISICEHNYAKEEQFPQTLHGVLLYAIRMSLCPKVGVNVKNGPLAH